MDNRLAGRDGKRYSAVLAGHFCQIDNGEGGIEVELESPEVSGLAVAQSGIGLGISKAELQLETRSVAVDYILGSHRLIRTEVYLPLVRPSFNRVPDSHLDEALQAFGICFQSKKTAMVHLKFDAPRRIQIGEVNLPVKPSGMSTLSGGLLRSRIPQCGIVPQSADHVEAFFQQGKDESVLGKECIRNQVLGYGQQLVFHSNQKLPVPVHQVVVHLLKGLGVGCLQGAENHTFMIVNVNQANPHQFKTAFHRCCGTRPELPKPGRLVARLRDKARVHRNGTELTSTDLVHKVEVEREPIEVIPGEGVPVGLFEEHSVPAHVQKSLLVGDGHEKF